MSSLTKQKGFTLIELLVVIGILAILAVIVILYINPAEILAQSRDSQRLSDLGSIKSAIGLYLSTNISPPNNLEVGGVTTTLTTTGAACPFGVGQCTGGGFWVPVDSFAATSSVDGTGWVRVNLTNSSAGSSLAALPLDPTSDTNYYYGYTASSSEGAYKIGGRLESVKYQAQMIGDGGTQNCPNSASGDWITNCYYEVGSDINL